MAQPVPWLFGMWTIRSSFVIVRGRLQRQDDNINFIATRLTSIDTAVMDSPPNWFDGDDQSEEVSLRTCIVLACQNGHAVSPHHVHMVPIHRLSMVRFVTEM